MRAVAVLGACAVVTLTACASSSNSGATPGGRAHRRDLGARRGLDETLSKAAPHDARVDLLFDGSQVQRPGRL